MKSDASDYANNGIFFQLGKNRLLYPIALFSKNLNPTEYNYEIYDKKLLVIIWCFE